MIAYHDIGQVIFHVVDTNIPDRGIWIATILFAPLTNGFVNKLPWVNHFNRTCLRFAAGLNSEVIISR